MGSLPDEFYCLCEFLVTAALQMEKSGQSGCATDEISDGNALHLGLNEKIKATFAGLPQ